MVVMAEAFLIFTRTTHCDASLEMHHMHMQMPYIMLYIMFISIMETNMWEGPYRLGPRNIRDLHMCDHQFQTYPPSIP